jgi:hypothetical protein
MYKQIIYLYHSSFNLGNVLQLQKAIFTLTNNILTALNQLQQLEGIFCELAKAFDRGNHKILLGKLFYYGTH